MENDQISRIKQRLADKGMSAAAASVAAGHGPDLLRNLFAGRSQNLRSDSLQRLAAVLDVTPQWIMTGTDKPSTVAQDTRGAIPEIDVRAGAGGGGFAETALDYDSGGAEQVAGLWTIPLHYLRGELHADPRNLRIIEVLGDSMAPTLLPHDRILVDISHKAPSPPGVYVLWDGFGLVVKRLEIVHGTDPLRVVVSSDNPNHAERELTVDEAHVKGRVVARVTGI